MKLLTAVLVIAVCGGEASLLQFLHAPSSVHLPENAQQLRTSDVPVITEQLIGLTAERPDGWTGYGDLLDRPKAAAIIVLNTPDHFKPVFDGAKYTLAQTAGLNLKSLDFDMKTAFSEERRVSVQSSAASLDATNVEGLADMDVDGLVHTKITPLRQELENVHRIILWLEKTGAQLWKSGAPDLFVVRISGLASALTSAGPADPDTKAALEEVTQAISKLATALRKAYGDQVLVEMVTQLEGGNAPSSSSEDEHIIVKRQATNAPIDPTKINVYPFTNQNYPAAFAIVAGVSLFLAIAVLFIGVGMWTMDPGKDSIIYRMTTPRMKKD